MLGICTRRLIPDADEEVRVYRFYSFCSHNYYLIRNGMVFDKKEIDPTKYVDVLRAIHITHIILKDALYALTVMELIDRKEATYTFAKMANKFQSVVQHQEWTVVDEGEKFRLIIRGDR